MQAHHYFDGSIYVCRSSSQACFPWGGAKRLNPSRRARGGGRARCNLGKDHRPSQKVAGAPWGKPNPQLVLYLQGLQQVQCHKSLPKDLGGRPEALLRFSVWFSRNTNNLKKSPHFSRDDSVQESLAPDLMQQGMLPPRLSLNPNRYILPKSLSWEISWCICSVSQRQNGVKNWFSSSPG